MEGEKLIVLLEKNKEFEETVLCSLSFSLCKGDRIEVRISAFGAEYVHEKVEEPEFLSGIIELFCKNHGLTIEEICAYFAKFSERYVCVKIEMGHTIYHRFTEADYRLLTVT